MANILLVEDDIAFVHLVENFLKKKNHHTVSKYKIKEALSEITANTYELVLLDYNLPDGNAFDFMAGLQARQIKTPVIIMTAFNDVKTAVKAIHSGASDYITKPVNPEELNMLIEQNTRLKKPDTRDVPGKISFIRGESGISKALNKHIELVAPTGMSVIIQGESGTGKENVARNIHQYSSRASGPFVAIDCGALSDELASSELFGHIKGAFTGAMSDKKGEFEMAKGGTLFLDEVGNLSYQVQVKLLRAVQEREIQPLGSNRLVKTDVRIITATNDDLRAAVKKGTFREDLFHRLNEFSILVPPLRQREKDLELFIAHFIKQSNIELSRQVKDVSPEVLKIFKTYKWPGNLRELKNIIKRSVLLAQSDYITVADIPLEMYQPQEDAERDETTDLKRIHEMNEKELIVKTLKEVKFNKTKAAALLNIDRKTLYIKIMKYGIDS